MVISQTARAATQYILPAARAFAAGDYQIKPAKVDSRADGGATDPNRCTCRAGRRD
jgi:hypothetical protein